MLTPTVYQDKQKRKVRCALPDNPYGWNDSTVSGILERMEYCGHTVNFKTHRQSYKIKKTIENPPDQWKIFRNTHEAIVDEETFDRVQELRRNKRRPAKTGKSNLFSGVAYCADCGEKLYYCTTQNFEERQDHFVCSTSRKKGKDVCRTHFIRAMVLEKGVLQFLQILLWYISDCEDLFREKLGAKRKEEFKKELAAKRRQLTQAQRRIEELDRLFKRIYEDNISGKIDVCTVVARSLCLRRRSSTPRCRRPLYGHDAGYAVSGIGAAPSIWKFCRVPKRGKICADRIIYIVANCAV